MDPYRVVFGSLPWVEPLAGIRFKVYRQGDKQVRLVEIASAFVEPDWCETGHVGCVLDGRIEIDFDGDPVVFNPGDGLLIPPGKEHKHKPKALSDVVRLLLVEDV